MFTNFLYFIIAILIFSTYQPSEETNFTFFETVLLFLSISFVFAAVSRSQFRRIRKQIATERFMYLDHKLSATVTRQSILALVVFAVDVYGLNVSSFLSVFSLFSTIPTLSAIVLIGLFTGYMAIVWAFAYDTHRVLYQTDMPRSAYVTSNLSFCVPVILPWIVLSIVSDVIFALPFEFPQKILSTTEGEICYFLFFLLTAAVFGPALIQKFWRCKPLEPGAVRGQIEYLCRKAGVPCANILYWPIFGGRMITAGVMGLIDRFRYILVTGGLINLLRPEEIDAVIAHEIGHVKKHHLLYYLFFFIGYMFISYALFDLVLYAVIYSRPVYALLSAGGAGQTTVTTLIFSLFIFVIFIVYFRFVFGYFMRNFERQADTYVYTLFDSAMPLVTTLKKIAVTSGQPIDKPNWHHFSIKQRIDFLLKCESNRSWIKRHERKIKKSLAVYLIAVAAIGAVGWHLNFGETGKKLNSHFIETILTRELKTHPDDANLYSLLGDLYYSRQEYEKTIRAYESSIALEPENANVLNNLAWLYATCEEKKFILPERALELAKRAITLKKAPHIYDTLAESFFINGMVEDAVKAETLALETAKKERSVYVKQLEKYRRALK